MEIHHAEFVISQAVVSKCPNSTIPEYAFIGRSNVGKSSLINMLTQHKKLAKTSSTPGKTLLINYFLVDKAWYIVDLPGYGYAKRSKTEQDKLRKMIESYVLQRQQLTNLFLLIDSRLEAQKVDLEFIGWLGLNNIPFSIVFTKADKQSKGKTGKNVEAFLENLKEEWEELPPYFITSAEEGTGRDEMLEYIDSINKSVQAQEE